VLYTFHAEDEGEMTVVENATVIDHSAFLDEQTLLELLQRYFGIGREGSGPWASRKL
jgi:hypothetical protein